MQWFSTFGNAEMRCSWRKPRCSRHIFGTMVQPSPHIRPLCGGIQFPFPSLPDPGEHWSLIFHCHSEPFDEVSDTFKRAYTTGEKLQSPLKPQGPLALFERRLPRLTDGLIQFVYEGCRDRLLDSSKWYELPIDTCQSTGRGKGSKSANRVCALMVPELEWLDTGKMSARTCMI